MNSEEARQRPARQTAARDLTAQQKTARNRRTEQRTSRPETQADRVYRRTRNGSSSDEVSNKTVSSRRSPKRRQAVPLTPSCIIMEAVKWIAFVLVLVLLFMGNRKDKPSETPFEAMKTAVLKEAKLPDAKEAENQMVRRLYGIDPSNFDGVYLAAPSTNMDVNELLILRVRGGHEKEMAAEAVQARLDAQLSAFEGYGVIQTGLLSHAVIENRGDYILYYVGEDPENVQRAFSEAL